MSKILYSNAFTMNSSNKLSSAAEKCEIMDEPGDQGTVSNEGHIFCSAQSINFVVYKQLLLKELLDFLECDLVHCISTFLYST